MLVRSGARGRVITGAGKRRRLAGKGVMCRADVASKLSREQRKFSSAAPPVNHAHRRCRHRQSATSTSSSFSSTETANLKDSQRCRDATANECSRNANLAKRLCDVVVALDANVLAQALLLWFENWLPGATMRQGRRDAANRSDQRARALSVEKHHLLAGMGKVSVSTEFFFSFIVVFFFFPQIPGKRRQ